MMKIKKKLKRRQARATYTQIFIKFETYYFSMKTEQKSVRFEGTHAEIFENLGNLFTPQNLWNLNDNLDIKIINVIKIKFSQHERFLSSSFRSFVENQ